MWAYDTQRADHSSPVSSLWGEQKQDLESWKEREKKKVEEDEEWRK